MTRATAMSPAAIRAWDLQETSRHEAAHAVIAVLLDLNAEHVEINDTDVSDEHLWRSRSVTGRVVGCYSVLPEVALTIWRTRPVPFGWAAKRRLAVAAPVRVAVAGAAILEGDPDSLPSHQWQDLATGSAMTDFEKVAALLSGVMGPDHADPWSSRRFAAAIDEEWERVVAALETAHDAVDRVATVLAREKYLEWETVEDLVGDPPQAAVERIREQPTWTKWAEPLHVLKER